MRRLSRGAVAAADPNAHSGAAAGPIRYTLDVTVNKVGTHAMHQVPAAGFDATAHLDRSDFGVGAHVPMVSDRIDLRITAEAIESKAWGALRSQFE